jgi:hypothetical protein
LRFAREAGFEVYGTEIPSYAGERLEKLYFSPQGTGQGILATES